MIKEEINRIFPENLTVFMESTGIYHLPVERYFKEDGFDTLVINSLTTKNNYDIIRKTKTDKKDCYRLAKLFFVHGAISKRGNKYARWILFNISQMVVKLGHQCPNHPVYKYYLMRKAEGKHYYESLTANFLKKYIVFACLPYKKII